MKFLFPGFKTKALTFSYDDGTVEDKWLCDTFRKYNVKATFNINGGLYNKIDDFAHGGGTVHMVRIAPEWAKGIYEGFEIAAHGYSHLIITNAEASARSEDLLKDIESHEKIFGVRPVGYAYPCGMYDDDAVEFLKGLGIRYARTTNNTNAFEIPEDFLKWHPTCHDKDALPLAKEFASKVFDTPQLLYIWGHSFELQKTDFNHYENIKSILETVSGKDDIWYAENGEIERYVTAARAVEIKDGKYVNNSGIEIYIENEDERMVI